MADSSNRRQKAAAARAAAESSEKRRERTIRIVGAIVVLVVVAGIIGIAVFARNSASSAPVASPTAATDPAAPVPSGVLLAGDDREFGVPYGTAAPGAPVLEIWEDFQCPACHLVEQANGAHIGDLAEAGTIQLVWRPTAFLDQNLRNDASSRAIAAWGCAIDAGKVREYHDLIYANQPANEGDGFSSELLLSLGEQAGITGAELDNFNQCVADGTYLPWAANATVAMTTSGINATPTALLNGVELTNDIVADPTKLDEAIAGAAKQ